MAGFVPARDHDFMYRGMLRRGQFCRGLLSLTDRGGRFVDHLHFLVTMGQILRGIMHHRYMEEHADRFTVNPVH